jgi:lipopolysaccharide export system protein LptA
MGNVKVVQDTLTLLTSSATYDGNTKNATSNAGVRLYDKKITLTADVGRYDTKAKIAYFQNNVSVIDTTANIHANELTYFRNESRAIARGQVKVFLKENNTTIYGDSLEWFEKRKYTVMTVNPKLVQIDTTTTTRIDSLTGARSDSISIDTLIVTCKVLESYQDSTNRFIATDSVEITRGTLAARSSFATFLRQDSLVILQTDPIVWYQENQLSGDSIAIQLRQRRLDKVFVRGAAFAISRPDVSGFEKRFDQLSGQDLTMSFRNDKIHQIEVEQNATSLYYYYDEGKANGVNASSGDKIIIHFVNGKVDNLRIYGGVEGKYYPEKMVRGKEGNFNLAGFRWEENRPRKKEE